MANPRVQVLPYAQGDEVWVPLTEVRKHRADFEPVHGGAVVHGTLAGRGDWTRGVARTWYVDVHGLTDTAGVQMSIPISSRRFRRHAKILIVRIGDWEIEQPTLNPLAASLKAQAVALAAAQRRRR